MRCSFGDVVAVPGAAHPDGGGRPVGGVARGGQVGWAPMTCSGTWPPAETSRRATSVACARVQDTRNLDWFCIRYAVDGIAVNGCRGIALGGDHHRHRRPGAQRSGWCCSASRERLVASSLASGLASGRARPGLLVAEPRVVLDHHPGRGQAQPRVQQAPVRGAAPRIVHRGLDDAVKDLAGQRRRCPAKRRVGADPAGVRAAVPFLACLKSCAGSSGTALTLVGEREQDTSGPSRNSTTTAAAAPARASAAPRLPATIILAPGWPALAALTTNGGRTRPAPPPPRPRWRR